MKKTALKFTPSKIFCCHLSFSLFSFFAINSLSITQTQAADFSKAKQTYVPPSYIRRDLDALGTNSWSFPGLNSSSIPGGQGSLISPAANGAPSDAAINQAAIDSSSRWGNLKEAASHYKDIPGLSPQLDKIKTRVASLIHQGKYGEAEDLARSGLKYFPNSSVLKGQFATATSMEAQSFLLTKNYDSAGKKAREALVADPNNKKAKIVIGKVMRAQGLDPNSHAAHVAVGDALAADGRLLEASVEYKSSLEIKPNAPAHVGLGNLAIGKGQVSEAHRHFEQALAIDPNSALAYRQRGALRYITQDTVGANADFSKAVSLAPNDHLASDALIGLWKQQVANDPKSANAHLGLARAYLQTNNLEAARNEYKSVVAIDPNNPALPAARNSFKIALAKEQSNQCVVAAKTLEGQGANQEAYQKLSEALQYSPTDPQTLMAHAQLCEKMGMTQQAHASYMAVIKADPKNLEAAHRLKALASGGGLKANEQQWSQPLIAPAPSMATQQSPPSMAPLRSKLPAPNSPIDTRGWVNGLPPAKNPVPAAPNNSIDTRGWVNGLPPAKDPIPSVPDSPIDTRGWVNGLPPAQNAVPAPNSPIDTTGWVNGLPPLKNPIPSLNAPNFSAPNMPAPNNMAPNNIMPMPNNMPPNRPMPNNFAPTNGPNDSPNAPLKSPLGYAPTDEMDFCEIQIQPQCVYSAYPAYPGEVGMLSNFARSMRTLMVLGQQALQLNTSNNNNNSSDNNSKYREAHTNSMLSSSQPDYF